MRGNDVSEISQDRMRIDRDGDRRLSTHFNVMNLL